MVTSAAAVPAPVSPRSSSGLAPNAVFRHGSLLRGGRPPRRHGFRTGHGGRPASRPSDRLPLRRRLSGALIRNRRLAVALLLCVAAGIAVQQLTPAPAATVHALAATRDLPAGKALEAADVAILKFPQGMLPGGSYSDPASLQGKQLAIALRQGQLISDTQLLGPGLLAGHPPGSAAVPLRMADAPSIQLVSPGELINVVMSGSSGLDQPATSEVVAAAVPVLWTSAQGGKADQWLASEETDGLIVVAADPDQARRLAGASSQGKLFFVLVAPAPG